MKIGQILDRKGRTVVTVPEDRTVQEAVQVLVDHGIGAVVVVEGDEVLGILSERDVLRLSARATSDLRSTRVREIMTTDVVVGEEADTLSYVMEILTRNRIRHLPIMKDGHLRGIISIGDVVNALRDEVEAENRYLKDYIRGVTY